MPSKRRNGQIFYRTLYSLLTIVLVMALLNAVLISYMKTGFIDAHIDVLTETLDHSATLLDEALRSGRSIYSSLQSSPDIASLISLPQQNLKDSYITRSSISDQLAAISTSHNYISEIYIYIYDQDYLITTNGTTEKSTFFHNRFAGEADEFYRQLEEPHFLNNIRKLPFGPSDKKLQNYTYSSLAMMQTLRTDGRAWGTLIIMLNPDKLTDSLARYLLPDCRPYVLIDGEIVAANQNAQIDIEALPETPYIGYVHGTGIVMRVASEYSSSLEYLVVEPEESILPKYTNVIITVNAVLFLAVILFALLSLLLSRRLYSPIHTLMREFGEDVGPSTNEGEVLMTAIKTLNQENKTIQHTLDSSAGLIRDALLYHLLRGHGEEDPVLISRYLEPDKHSGKFYSFVINIRPGAEEEDSVEVILRRIRQDIDSLAISLIKTGETEYVLVSYPLDDKQFAFFVRAMQAAIADMADRYPASLIVSSVGAGCAHISLISSGFREARERIFSHSILENHVFIHPDAPGNTARELIPFNMETTLASFISAGETEKAWDYIASILDRNRKKNISAQKYVSVAYLINTVLFRASSMDDKQDAKQMLHIHPSHTFVRSESLDIILQENLTLLMVGPASSPDDFDRIKAFVDEHFMENINLSVTAAHFGYNVSYLSRYFKQRAGINFLDYLNRKKVEAACQLLLGSKESIRSIAEKTGFGSASQFIVTFERLVGTTPGAFRKQASPQPQDK